VVVDRIRLANACFQRGRCDALSSPHPDPTAKPKTAPTTMHPSTRSGPRTSNQSREPQFLRATWIGNDPEFAGVPCDLASEPFSCAVGAGFALGPFDLLRGEAGDTGGERFAAAADAWLALFVAVCGGEKIVSSIVAEAGAGAAAPEATAAGALLLRLFFAIGENACQPSQSASCFVVWPVNMATPVLQLDNFPFLV
jgi:hypothetical protein